MVVTLNLLTFYQNYGVRKSSLNLLSSYLNNRIQKIKMNVIAGEEMIEEHSSIITYLVYLYKVRNTDLLMSNNFEYTYSQKLCLDLFEYRTLK